MKSLYVFVIKVNFFVLFTVVVFEIYAVLFDVVPSTQPCVCFYSEHHWCLSGSTMMDTIIVTAISNTWIHIAIKSTESYTPRRRTQTTQSKIQEEIVEKLALLTHMKLVRRSMGSFICRLQLRARRIELLKVII